MFEYCAIIRSVYDGDTLRADIDLGFGIWQMNQPIRIYGIDTPELSSSEGRMARDYAKALLEGKTVVMTTLKDKKEKYGRYLAKIAMPNGEDYATLMIALGLAVPYYGGTKPE
jgi:micrococcal nuclease